MKFIINFTILAIFLLSANCQAETGSKSSFAVSSSELLATENALGSLKSIFPDSLKQKKSVLYTFCPDSTCIELSAKNNQHLSAFMVIYLYYEGDYYDLQKWRQIDNVNESVRTLSKTLKINSCVDKIDKNHLCLKSVFRHAGIKVKNVRYDEGRKFTKTIW